MGVSVPSLHIPSTDGMIHYCGHLYCNYNSDIRIRRAIAVGIFFNGFTIMVAGVLVNSIHHVWIIFMYR